MDKAAIDGPMLGTVAAAVGVSLGVVLCRLGREGVMMLARRLGEGRLSKREDHQQKKGQHQTQEISRGQRKCRQHGRTRLVSGVASVWRGHRLLRQVHVAIILGVWVHAGQATLRRFASA